jgi:DNA-binding XRE family transcriptional regulator
MKTSASLQLLPFEVEETLLQLGGRVAAARKARGLTQQDLAAKAGIGLNTMVSIESSSAKPVWVWLPGAHQPVQCGTFSLVNAVGALEGCDDTQAKRAYQQPPLASELFEALRHLSDTRPSSQAAREVRGLGGIQSMAITRSGSSIATQANLLQDCQGFACSKEAAATFITHARDVLLDRWPRLVRSCGYEPDQLPVKDPAEWLSRS